MCLGDRRPTQIARAIDPALLQKVAMKQESMEMPLNPEIIQPPRREMKSSNVKPEVKKETPKETHRAHIIVQHHYHDHSMDRPEQVKQEHHPARGGVVTPFPMKLHEMLRQLEIDGHDHIVSWQPHGRCFVVHKAAEFVRLLPRYFKLSKLASFQRQLNLYGFQRLTRGKDRGGYYHELFLRSMPFLAQGIQRIKVKGTGVRARSNPDQEPNFYKMPFVGMKSFSVPPMILPRSIPIQSYPTSFLPNPTQMSMSSQPMPVMSRPSIQQTQVQSSFSLEPTAIEDFDVVCGFGNKKFHYLDPYQLEEAEKLRNVELPPRNAEGFFKDFSFPHDIGVEIEDDEVFGNMLEQMIS
jgi:hypothetical protein